MQTGIGKTKCQKIQNWKIGLNGTGNIENSAVVDRPPKASKNSYNYFLFSSLVPTPLRQASRGKQREAEAPCKLNQTNYSFFRKKNQKLLPDLASCFPAFVHLSGNFTPSAISLRDLRNSLFESELEGSSLRVEWPDAFTQSFMHSACKLAIYNAYSLTAFVHLQYYDTQLLQKEKTSITISLNN